jgi:cysteine desulfurase / selenocysteine lyase
MDSTQILPVDFDIEKIRSDFPILHQNIYNRPLVYLDNAATTQKPTVVLDAVTEYYSTINSNIHRGVHYLSQQATHAYEEVRKNICKFMNARFPHEIIFTRGTTESINLVASSFGKKFLKADDIILVTELEHHSNIVPWQIQCEEKGAHLKAIPITDEGEFNMDAFRLMLNEKVKLIAVAHVSNALGTVLPVKEIIHLAHQHDIPVLIDGAQAVAHHPVDVQDLDADFYCFSGHKIYAPMGIGVLYGKEEWLEVLPPYQGGGEMIRDVTFEKTTYNDLPFKFEAGTPNVSDTIGLNTALKYLENIGMDSIGRYEQCLLDYATEKISALDGIKIIGTAKEKTGVLSFLPGEIHPYDMGTILDKLGIALRTGNHCAQPLMNRLGITGTIRASFALYNTREEIDILAKGIKQVQTMFA